MARIGLKSLGEYPLRKLFDIIFRPVNLDKNEPFSGIFGWLVLGLYVIFFDIYAIKSRKIETLTKSFWRITEKIFPGSILIGVWVILSLHLLIEKQARRAYQRRLDA
jgi:hypothetical protein